MELRKQKRPVTISDQIRALLDADMVGNSPKPSTNNSICVCKTPWSTAYLDFPMTNTLSTVSNSDKMCPEKPSKPYAVLVLNKVG
jgi:hypothetical protein